MNNPNFNTILAEALAREKKMSEGCKPLTNYERLVTKTPEELADFLPEIRNALTCIMGTKEGCLHPDDPCSECWLDWLMAPADKEGGV